MQGAPLTDAKGTTTEEKGSAATEGKTTEGGKLTKGSILIVEDEAVTALALKRSLGALGYEVSGIAVSGSAALESARKQVPDLVLMDIRLPGDMDGVAAAALLKDQFNLPIIFLTAHSDQATIERVRVTEPCAYLVKPYTEGALRAAIEVGLYTHRIRSARRDRGGEHEALPAADQQRRFTPVEGASILEAIDTHPLFAALSQSEREALMRGATIRSLRPGEMIVGEGDENPQLFIVRRGRVSTIKVSADGRELMVDLLFPGELMGLLGAIENIPQDLVFRAPVRAEVIMLPSATFAVLLRENSRLLLQISQHLSQRLERAYELALALAHAKVENRVASVLCELAERQSGARDNAHGVRVEITRQELALLVATSYETIIRTMKQMGEDGLIIPKGRSAIEISDLDRLRSMITRGEGANTPV